MNDVTSPAAPHLMPVSGADVELIERGSGAPLLFLHGAQGVPPADNFLTRLAAKRRVIAPSHPGFGASSLPDWLDSVDDIAHIHLELLDRLNIDRFDLVGCSIGGWIAAEMATKSPERVRRLVLVGPVGVKVGPVDRLDIPDIFAMPADRLNTLIYHDPKNAPDLRTLPEPVLATMARNRETLALLTWEPYMHNPKLKHRLHRVGSPTLFVRGESDGLVSAQYLAGYAAFVPNARTMTVAKAGHAPQVEQPGALAAAVLEFLEA
jgi:pimeloyl-ACP methyl ester carboxylesterase